MLGLAGDSALGQVLDPHFSHLMTICNTTLCQMFDVAQPGVCYLQGFSRACVHSKRCAYHEALNEFDYTCERARARKMKMMMKMIVMILVVDVFLSLVARERKDLGMAN